MTGNVCTGVDRAGKSKLARSSASTLAPAEPREHQEPEDKLAAGICLHSFALFSSLLLHLLQTPPSLPHPALAHTSGRKGVPLPSKLLEVFFSIVFVWHLAITEVTILLSSSLSHMTFLKSVFRSVSPNSFLPLQENLLIIFKWGIKYINWEGNICGWYHKMVLWFQDKYNVYVFPDDRNEEVNWNLKSNSSLLHLLYRGLSSLGRSPKQQNIHKTNTKNVFTI